MPVVEEMASGGATERRPLEDGFMAIDSDGERVQLIGSYSPAADTYFFPRRLRCPLTGTPVEDRLLSSRGTIYSWTYVYHPLVGRVRYANSAGYGVIQADLPEGVRIQAIVLGEGESWEIGAPVELVAHPVATADDGAQLCSFAFRLIEETSK